MDENQKTVRVLDTQAFRTTVVEYFGEDTNSSEIAEVCALPMRVIDAVLSGETINDYYVVVVSQKMGVDPAQFYRVETWKRVTE